LQRIASSSAGVIALAADSNNPLDLSSDAIGGNFTAASLGAVGSATYGGTLTPNRSTYRFGGGGGRLTIASALSGNPAAIPAAPSAGPRECAPPPANTHSGVPRLPSGTLTLANANALQNSPLDLAPAGSGTLNVSNLSPTLGGLEGSRAAMISAGQTL